MIVQGQRYSYEGYSVLAVESAERGQVAVRRINPLEPLGLEKRIYVAAERLVAEPMNYFSGQTSEGKRKE
jgi:hypothetical protein